jgi:hypothetical protein
MKNPSTAAYLHATVPKAGYSSAQATARIWPDFYYENDFICQ